MNVDCPRPHNSAPCYCPVKGSRERGTVHVLTTVPRATAPCRAAVKPFVYELSNKFFVRHGGIATLRAACTQAGYGAPSRAPKYTGDIHILVKSILKKAGG